MNRELKIVGISLFTWALGEGAFLYLIPLHLEQLDADAVQIGNILAAFALVQAIITLPAGVLTDRIGARKVMIGGWALGTISTLWMAMTRDLGTFAIAYISFGLSFWPVPALSQFITTSRGQWTPERALTITFAFYSAGMIVSPVLGGWVAEKYGVPSVMFIASAMFIISTLVILRTQEETSGLPLLEGSRYRGLLKNRRFLGVLALGLSVIVVLSLGVPLAPNFLRTRWNLSLTNIGLLGSVASLGEVLWSVWLGNKSPSKALRTLLIFSFFYLVLLLSSGQMGILMLAFFLRAGYSIARPFIYAMSMRVVHFSQRGLAFAGSATFVRLANMGAAAIAGRLYSFRIDAPFQIGLVLIPMVFLLICVVPIPRQLLVGETH